MRGHEKSRFQEALGEEDVESGSCAHLESEVLAEHPGIESSGGASSVAQEGVRDRMQI